MKRCSRFAAVSAPSTLLLGALIVAAFMLVVLLKSTYTTSDPGRALLVSQTILKHGTIKLDTYGDTIRSDWRVHQKNEHTYYYFPIGSPLLTVPVVALTTAFGVDMADEKNDRATQVVLAAFTAALTVYLLYRIAGLFLGWRESLAVTALMWAGSAFVSTNGAAFWSHDPASVLALGAIFIALEASERTTLRHWPLLAVLLFSAYLCRPTMSLFVVFLLAYVFLHHKKEALYAAAGVAALLAVFIAWSFHEYAQYLPDYYMPKRLDGGRFLDALYGNSFGPARGLFVFSPFLLLPFFFLPRLLRSKWRAILLLGVAWPVAHLVSISQFPQWWAGYSFGPRLMVDAMPGLFVLLCLALACIDEHRTWVAAYAFLALTGGFSLYVNSYKGLFDEYSAFLWNAEPSVSTYNQLLFDWRYPQFLHTRARHERRLEKFARAQRQGGG